MTIKELAQVPDEIMWSA